MTPDSGEAIAAKKRVVGCGTESVERIWKLEGSSVESRPPKDPVIAHCPAPPVSPNQPKRRSP